jgi:hypothetical protein
VFLQVKFPKFNEIVNLTLPDGTERSGQVLEARGTSKQHTLAMALQTLCLFNCGTNFLQVTVLSSRYEPMVHHNGRFRSTDRLS